MHTHLDSVFLGSFQVHVGDGKVFLEVLLVELTIVPSQEIIGFVEITTPDVPDESRQLVSVVWAICDSWVEMSTHSLVDPHEKQNQRGG